MTVLVKPLQARFLELEDQGKLDLETLAEKLGVEKKGVKMMLGFYSHGRSGAPQVTVTDVTAERLNAIFEAAA